MNLVCSQCDVDSILCKVIVDSSAKTSSHGRKRVGLGVTECGLRTKVRVVTGYTGHTSFNCPERTKERRNCATAYVHGLDRFLVQSDCALAPALFPSSHECTYALRRLWFHKHPPSPTPTPSTEKCCDSVLRLAVPAG